MVDIQSAAAQIRQGKKKEETTGRKYYGLPYSIERPQIVYDHLIEVAPSFMVTLWNRETVCIFMLWFVLVLVLVVVLLLLFFLA